MPEIFTVGRGNPTEAEITEPSKLARTLLTELMPTRTIWAACDLSSASGLAHKTTLKQLREAAQEGLVLRLGASGATARWCHPSHEAEARKIVDEMREETRRNRVLRHSARRTERRAAKRQNKPTPPPRVAPPKERLLEAFTIPPRGVPCSVWSLGDMA